MRNMLKELSLSMALAGLICAAPIGAVPATHESNSASAAANQDRSVSRVMSDATITAKVKSDLIGDKQVEARNINVDTVKGVVHLRGTVKTRAEAKRAIALAKRVGGVKGVKSHLKIAQSTAKSSQTAAKPM
jgi:hyperosmotically inducible protein